MGTVSYMSPEQSLALKTIDYRTDIWSLGAVLYEMITGRVPFEGKDLLQQIVAIQEQPHPPLSKLVEHVPEQLERIIDKALAKNPDERYQTTTDMLIDMRSLKRQLENQAENDRTALFQQPRSWFVEGPTIDHYTKRALSRFECGVHRQSSQAAQARCINAVWECLRLQHSRQCFGTSSTRELRP